VDRQLIPPPTMVPPKAAAPSRAQQNANMTSHSPPNDSATKSSETREYDIILRAFFPTPSEPTKFNPIPAMTQLLRSMLKDEPSLVLRTANNDQQIVLATMPIPTNKSEFQKFFKVSTTRIFTRNKSNVCIGCNILSNRTLGNIKFQSQQNHLLAWLKQAQVFLESDQLGTERPTTIGYITKIATDITNLKNFRDHLANQLLLIKIDPETAISLAPHLKQAQLDVMSNGDEYVPILPEFELYRTCLSHGRDPTKITTDVVGIKSAPKDAKLLGKFFTRLAAETSDDQRDGVFLPKGAMNLIGPTTYAQVLTTNNHFLNQVATIPVNLELNAWHAIIDPTDTSENHPISLHDHLLRQPWFLRLESVTRNKCLLVTNKSNLPTARAWIDAHLEGMVRKSIPPGIDPPLSLLPRRLDNPVYTAAGQSYADILKKQFSVASDSTTTTTNLRPPKKRQATVIDYDSDQSADATPFAKQANPQKPTATDPGYATELSSLKTEISQLKVIITTAVPAPNTKVDYAAELQTIKTELATLRNLVTSAVEQMTRVVAPITPHTSPAPVREMEIDDDHPKDRSKETTSAISDLISELKNDIANIASEMREKFQAIRALPQPIPFQLTPYPT